MKVATFNGCKVYNLSSGKTAPQFLSEAKKRALAKDEEYRKRMELIQDFEMTTASQCIRMTKDKEHIIVTGTYPPVVKCYTTTDMAMKFQRGLTCEVVAMECLSDNFGKLVFLQADRTLNFQAPYGTHYSIRVPKYGRDLAYNWANCDLYVGGSCDELYRLNLERGQFNEPFKLEMTGCNKLHINPVNQLLGCGGEQALCEFWDPRTRKAITKLRVDRDLNVQVTALKFDTDGLTMAVGTSNGNCILYDIRSSTPVYTKEHQYGFPVLDVTFHNSSKHILSTDKKIVKIWDREEPGMGKILTNIEPPADINAIQIVEDRRGPTGLIMLAGEQQRIMTYFVPQLGTAPRWCSFLEGLTEELEESSGQTVYEDYKFVTAGELEELGATGLVGTPVVRAYMHGYFMEMKLYNKLRAVSKPFEYEEHRKKKIRDKIEAKRQNRITIDKRLPKVNKELAEKLLRKSDKSKPAELVDNRFSSLFEREEFQVDENTEEFQLRNPVRSSKHSNRDNDSDDELQVEDIYDPVKVKSDSEDDYDDYGSDNDNSVEGNINSDNSDLDEIKADDYVYNKKEDKKAKVGRKISEEDEEDGQIVGMTKKIISKRQLSGRSSDHSNNGETYKKSKTTRDVYVTNNTKRGTPKMFELSDGVSSAIALFDHQKHMTVGSATIGTAGNHPSRKEVLTQKHLPLSERLKENRGGDSAKKGRGKTSGESIRYVKTTSDGLTREISFMPKSKSKR